MGPSDGKPTAREAESPSGYGMSEQANASSRKATGNRLDRTDVRPERVLTSDRWLTEDDRGAWGARAGRKGIRKPCARRMRLECHRLAPGGPACPQAPSGHLP